MKTFFQKTLDEIGKEDIEDLIGTPEGQTFEIKERLSEKDIEDPWMREPAPGKKREPPSDKAKEKIFKEIVAFANSEGGWLVLGIKESDDKPASAAGINPLPDCVELAERLWQAAQDWIDPPVPFLRCRGIPIDNGSGVVVCHVPHPISPHIGFINQKYPKRLTKGWNGNPNL